MKIKLALLIGLVTLASVINAQQHFVLTTNVTTIISVKPIVAVGTNATVIANQLLAVTNADGTLLVPQNLFSARSSTIIIRTRVTTNGLQSITASVH
jgi:hypothetical protein